MSGILNKKQRLIDLIVTSEGKKKLSIGKFKPSFISFSDRNTNYTEKGMTSKDFSSYSKIAIETVTNFHIDTIVFENDDSGRLFIGASPETDDSSVIGNKIFARDPDNLNLTGSDYRESLTSILTGSAFDKAANKIISASFKHFKKNQVIGTNISMGDSNDFEMELINDKNYFVMTNSSPFNTGPYGKTISLEAADPLMFDGKLAHLRNFLYLPPENTDRTSYGVYQDLRNTTKLSYQSIKNDLNITSLNYDYLEQDNTVVNEIGISKLKALNRKHLTDINRLLAKEKIEAYFSKSSRESNIITQIYEKNNSVGGNSLNKLEIVDVGEFIDDTDKQRKRKRVFHVGKVFEDSNKIATFINLFTIIWD